MTDGILGKNVVFGLFVEGEGYVPIFCAISADLVKHFDKIECTTKTSPNAREYRPGLSSAVVTATGVSSINTTTARISWFYLNQLADTRVLQSYQLLYTDEQSNVMALQFDGMIEDLGLSANVGEWSKSSVQIQVSGVISPAEVIEPPTSPQEYEELSDWWDTVPGQAYVQVSSVASGEHGYTLTDDDVILEIDRSGTQHDEVTGTPGNRQAKYNPTTNRIEVDPSNPFNADETIFVLFKRPV